ncbi:hypothetical protein D3C83_240280 [compost metagenome]
MLTARSASAGTLRSTGSLNSTAPAAMTALSLPPKVNLREVPGTIAGPFSRNATRAPPSGSGLVP